MGAIKRQLEILNEMKCKLATTVDSLVRNTIRIDIQKLESMLGQDEDEWTKNNEWYQLHDKISILAMMLKEIKQEDRSFLDGSECDSLSRQLMSDMTDAMNVDEIHNMLENGFKGYANMTDLELLVEVSDTTAGWSASVSELHDVYADIPAWIERAREQITTEMLEKTVLK